METPKPGLHDKLDRLIDMLEKQNADKTQKGFQLPFIIRAKAKTAAKKNKAVVLVLRNNRNAEPLVLPIENGLVKIGDKYHDAATWFFWLWKGKTPLLIVPEWSLTPIGTKDFEEAKTGGNLADPEATIIRAIETKEATVPKKITGKAIIWLLIAGVAGFYLITTLGN